MFATRMKISFAAAACLATASLVGCNDAGTSGTAPQAAQNASPSPVAGMAAVEESQEISAIDEGLEIGEAAALKGRDNVEGATPARRRGEERARDSSPTRGREVPVTRLDPDSDPTRAANQPTTSANEVARLTASTMQPSSDVEPSGSPTPVPMADHHIVIAEPMELHVGSMGLHETRTGTIRLTNTGDRPMRVADSRTSCGCTVANVPKGRSLSPGEYVDVDVSLRGGARPERLRKTVTFMVDGQPPLVATVVGETVAYVVIEPTALHPDRQPEGHIVVRSEDGTPFRITGVNPDIAADFGEEPTTHHELHVSWDAWRELGQARRLIVFTDHPKTPQISAMIHVRPDPSRSTDALVGQQRPQPPSRDLSGLIRSGDVDGVRSRIKEDAHMNLEVADGQGLTLLGLAARHGQSEIVAALIEAGADIHAADRTGRTPLMWAAHAKDVDAVRALIQAGAEVDARDTTVGNTALGWASAFGNAECVRELLEAGARTDTVSITGFTPLIWASAFGDAESIPMLIEAGAELEAVDPSHGQTPLMHAARMGKVDGVRRLVEHGADINARDPAGRTALLLAAGSSSSPVEAVDTLIAAGADVTVRDAQGMTALDHARTRRGRDAEEVVALLEKAAGSAAGHASE